MRKELFDAYNNSKASFIAKLIDVLIEVGGNELKVTFSPYIVITKQEDPDVCDFIEEITGIEYDKDENVWYVHNFITDETLGTEEYWTPLADFSIDDLFRIAERL